MGKEVTSAPPIVTLHLEVTSQGHFSEILPTEAAGEGACRWQHSSRCSRLGAC